MPSIPSATSPGVTTGTIASSRIVVPMLEEIQELDAVRRPLMFLLSLVGNVEVRGPVDQWHEEDRARIITGVDGATTFTGQADGATATITVDATTSPMFKIDHVVYARVNTGDAGNFRALVTGVDTDNDQIAVTLVTDGNNIAGVNIANNATLMVIGSSYEEHSSAPSSMAVQPTVAYNYIQHWRDTWSVSDYTDFTDMYGDPEMRRLANRITLRQLQDVENSFWWGIRRVNNPGDGTTHEGRRSTANQPRWMTGGVFWRITTNVTLADGNLGNYTYATFLTHLADAAQYNPGAMFSGFFGPDAISRFSNPAFMVGAGNGPVNHNRDILDQAFGFNITKLVTPHGSVLLFPSYESFHQRTADPAGGTNTLDIIGAVLHMKNMRISVPPGKSIGMYEPDLQLPGVHGSTDGVSSYAGLRMPNEAHHIELLFTSNT